MTSRVLKTKGEVPDGSVSCIQKKDVRKSAARSTAERGMRGVRRVISDKEDRVKKVSDAVRKG